MHQFDSRVEEIERQLQRALLSYGVSSPVPSADGREGVSQGRGRAVEDERGSEDDMS